MHQFALGLAFVLALAIITIGSQYLASPRAATRTFGLPLPEEDPNTAWWLRLKGVRDIVSGFAVLAFMTWGGSSTVGLILFVYVLIPVGDMLMILAAKGSTGRAVGIHGVTAVLMALAALPLVTGGR